MSVSGEPCDVLSVVKDELMRFCHQVVFATPSFLHVA